MHQCSIYHRDLKLENIIVEIETGTIKIIDFGLAKKFKVQENGELEYDNDYIGTPTYMAPEILMHRFYKCDKAEVFSLAIILFELVSGKHPFEDKMNLMAEIEDSSPISNTATKDNWLYISCINRSDSFKKYHEK